MGGVRGVDHTTGKFQPLSMDLSNPLMVPPPALHTMAACQALADLNGELIGDPLEIKIFQSTGAKLNDTVDGRRKHFTCLCCAVLCCAVR